jgi:1,2-diacylglycerol 3-alpha-glucosyltransferase
MNIGIATDTFQPRINGVVHSINIFTKELRRSGHRVIIFAPAFPQHIEEEEDVWRFPSHYSANTPGDRLTNPFRIGSLKHFRKLPDLKLDIMHTHTPFSLGIAMLAWARQKKIPTVHTYHTLFEMYVPHYAKAIPERIGRYLVHRGSRTFCNQHKQVVVPSRAMEKVLYTYGVKVPVEVVPTGVDLLPFKKQDPERMRRELGFGKKDPMLLSMGRISGEKNITFLFKVMEKLRVIQPRARLVLAGEGPGMKKLQKECQQRGLQDKVLFVGYVRGQDWVDLFAGADLHLLASLTETQGLVLTEAMAAGTPCVTVGAMGVRDIMTSGGGIMVSPKEQEFADAVHALLKNKTLLKEKQVEAKKIATKNSAQQRAKQIVKVYQKLI